MSLNKNKYDMTFIIRSVASSLELDDPRIISSNNLYVGFIEKDNEIITISTNTKSINKIDGFDYVQVFVSRFDKSIVMYKNIKNIVEILFDSELLSSDVNKSINDLMFINTSVLETSEEYENMIGHTFDFRLDSNMFGDSKVILFPNRLLTSDNSTIRIMVADLVPITDDEYDAVEDYIIDDRLYLLFDDACKDILVNRVFGLEITNSRPDIFKNI